MEYLMCFLTSSSDNPFGELESLQYRSLERLKAFLA